MKKQNNTPPGVDPIKNHRIRKYRIKTDHGARMNSNKKSLSSTTKTDRRNSYSTELIAENIGNIFFDTAQYYPPHIPHNNLNSPLFILFPPDLTTPGKEKEECKQDGIGENSPVQKGQTEPNNTSNEDQKQIDPNSKENTSNEDQKQESADPGACGNSPQFNPAFYGCALTGEYYNLAKNGIMLFQRYGLEKIDYPKGHVMKSSDPVYRIQEKAKDLNISCKVGKRGDSIRFEKLFPVKKENTPPKRSYGFGIDLKNLKGKKIPLKDHALGGLLDLICAEMRNRGTHRRDLWIEPKKVNSLFSDLNDSKKIYRILSRELKYLQAFNFYDPKTEKYLPIFETVKPKLRGIELSWNENFIPHTRFKNYLTFPDLDISPQARNFLRLICSQIRINLDEFNQKKNKTIYCKTVFQHCAMEYTSHFNRDCLEPLEQWIDEINESWRKKTGNQDFKINLHLIDNKKQVYLSDLDDESREIDLSASYENGFIEIVLSGEYQKLQAQIYKTVIEPKRKKNKKKTQASQK